MAKKGSEIKNHKNTPLSFHSAKLKIKSSFKKESTETINKTVQEKKWEKLLPNRKAIPELPRNEAVAAFRITTKHHCLAEHLYRMKISASPNCVLCSENSVMNWEHLRLCSALQKYWTGTDGQLYWEARRLMTMIQNV